MTSLACLKGNSDISPSVLKQIFQLSLPQQYLSTLRKQTEIAPLFGAKFSCWQLQTHFYF
jgi:hypothetical protein